MDKNEALQAIANSIHAAGKIKSTYESYMRSDGENPVFPDKLSVIKNILNIISEYSPEEQRRNMERTINKADVYSNTYKNLKQHLANSRSHKLNKENFVKTLEIVRPLAGNREKYMIDKILRLYDLFIS